MNVASRMCSHGEAEKVHLSPKTSRLLLDSFPEIQIEPRGVIHIKGTVDMKTYWLVFTKLSDR